MTGRCMVPGYAGDRGRRAVRRHRRPRKRATCRDRAAGPAPSRPWQVRDMPSISAAWSAARVTARREAINAGDRELRWTARRFGDDFRELRLRAGVSQAAVARSIGVDRSVVTRLERGDATVGNPIRARAAACLGADFRLQIYSQRAPMIFDAAHARVIERLLSAAHSRWHPVVEAPVPGPGRRS